MRTSPLLLLVTLRVLATLLLAAAPAAASSLTLLEAKFDRGDAYGWSGARAVVVSPDGRHVYVAGELSDAVAAFRRDPTTGLLTFLGSQRDGGEIDGLDGVRGLAISADGRHVYAASGVDDALVVFARDADTGLLSFVQVELDGAGRTNGLDGADAVVLSPDGASLYVAGRSDEAVAVFRRDVATGRVTFVEMQRDDTAGVDGLAGVRSLAMSPDGLQLYAAGALENEIAVFRRDPASGTLAYLANVALGTNGMPSLALPRALAISSDGRHLYVTAGNDDAVGVLARDAATGTLAFVARYQDDVDGVRGLNGANGVTVSPDGAHVYVTSDVDQALAIFDRDPVSGALTFIQRHHSLLGERSGEDTGLGGASGVAVSPDDFSVYVAGSTSDSVVVFGPARCGDRVRDAAEECDEGGDTGGCCTAECTLKAAGAACRDDGNVCTNDRCDARGICTHPSNTAPCDDGAFCSVDDRCQGGACQGRARDCADAAIGQCQLGVCDEVADACVSRASDDGTRCNDGDACTQGDACTAGACGGEAIVCASPGACRVAACVPAIGRCLAEVQRDGTSCDDGDDATERDVCSAGSCHGTRASDRDGDGVADAADVCPEVADGLQADQDRNGIGDACECTAPAPGRCLEGGGPEATDCLLELNPTPPASRHGRNRRARLRCADGDPACDGDRAANGRCAFAVAVCLGNRDPRLARCAPSAVASFEVMSPDPDRARSVTDRTNARALEDALRGMGVEIRRQGRTISPAMASVVNRCGPLATLVVPAPPAAPGKPVRKTFRLKASGGPRRHDVDVLTLECRR